MNVTCCAPSPGIVASWLGDVPDVEKVLPTCEYSPWDASFVSVQADYQTLGMVFLYTRGVAADWVDMIVTDLALESLCKLRIAEIESELGAPMSQLEVARQEFGYGHPDVPGSSTFTVIRLSRGVRRT